MLSEEKKKAINRLNLLNKELYIDNCNLVNSDDLRTVLNLITKLQKENEEKDKQIDLMARAFKQDDIRSVEEIKEYFKNQVK